MQLPGVDKIIPNLFLIIAIFAIIRIILKVILQIKEELKKYETGQRIFCFLSKLEFSKISHYLENARSRTDHYMKRKATSIWNHSSCAMGTIKPLQDRARCHLREFSLWPLHNLHRKIPVFPAEIQPLRSGLADWTANNFANTSFKFLLWVFIETIRVIFQSFFGAILSFLILSIGAGITAALWFLLTVSWAILSLAMLSVIFIKLSLGGVFMAIICGICWVPLSVATGICAIACFLKIFVTAFLKALFGELKDTVNAKELVTAAVSIAGTHLTSYPHPTIEFNELVGAIKQLNNKTELKGLQGAVNGLGTQIKAIPKPSSPVGLKGLQNSLDGLKGQIETIRGDSIQVESPTLQKKLEDLQSAVNGLGTQIEAIPKPSSSVELKGLQDSLNGLQKQIEALRKAIQVESPGLQKELKDLQVALNRLQKQIEEPQTADRAELQNLQKKLRNLQNAISDLKTQIKTMSKEELECLRKQLVDLNAQLKQPIVYKPWVIAKLVKGMAKLLGIGARKQQNGRQQSPPCPA